MVAGASKCDRFVVREHGGGSHHVSPVVAVEGAAGCVGALGGAEGGASGIRTRDCHSGDRERFAQLSGAVTPASDGGICFRVPAGVSVYHAWGGTREGGACSRHMSVAEDHDHACREGGDDEEV